MKDYYRILEVNCNCSQEDIEVAYKLINKQITYGNNVNKDLVEEAYSVLSDPDKRQEYNQMLYQFSKESEASFDTHNSYINSLEETKGQSEIQQDRDMKDELTKETSFVDQYFNYKYGAFVFGVLSLCLLFVLIFQKPSNEKKQWEQAENKSASGIENTMNQESAIQNESRESITSNETSVNPDSIRMSRPIIRGDINMVMENDILPPSIILRYDSIISYSEEDRIKWKVLVHEPRYKLKDPYPELTHDEKVTLLNTNTEDFFDRTYMNIPLEGDDTTTVKSALLQSDAEFSYIVNDNKAYMLIFIPALFIEHRNNVNMNKKDIFLFVLYELSVVEGNVYGVFTPMNPFAIFVTETFSDIDTILYNDYPWFEYISVESSREHHDNIIKLEDGQSHYFNTVMVEEDLKDSYLKLNFPSLGPDDIKESQKNYASKTYEYKLNDPYVELTETEKLAVLKDNPEEFFDAVLTATGKTYGITLQELYANAFPNSSCEYYVEDNKAYMYITNPINYTKSDGYNVVSSEIYFFIMYEIAVLPDGVYGKYDLMNPYVQLIKDRDLYKGVTPEEFRWEHGILEMDKTSLLEYYISKTKEWLPVEDIGDINKQP